MKIEGIGIHHVQITVPRSVEADAKRFYGQLLGLSEISKPHPLLGRGGAWYQLGKVQLHVSVEDIDVAHNEMSRRHVCYFVDDLDAAQAALSNAGVAIIADKQPIKEFIRFYVRDPGGNRVEIAQLV